MDTIRCATLTVADLERSRALYADWLDYQVVEEGKVAEALAHDWQAPRVAGAPYSVLRPDSGADVFLRLIQQPPHPDYRPLRTHGWAAIEINNQDTMGVAARMADSPFEIIGPPKEIPGLDAIFAMQVRGPDGEIVYLTQIRGDMPDYDLPRAQSMIDRLFILVLACSDMEATGAWATRLGFEKGRTMEIPYTMISQAFGQPPDTLHALATLKHGRDIALEIDQYPATATPRPIHPGHLPPCAAIGSFLAPDWDAVSSRGEPRIHDSLVYGGKPSLTLRDPDGALFEFIKP